MPASIIIDGGWAWGCGAAFPAMSGGIGGAGILLLCTALAWELLFDGVFEGGFVHVI
jgi:hypothetical protein